MNSKEALKRLKQETAPATYMVDFDKNECIEIIQQDLDQFEKLKADFELLKDFLSIWHFHIRYALNDIQALPYREERHEFCDEILWHFEKEQIRKVLEVLESE